MKIADRQITVKAHRDEYKDLTFKEQQQELGKKVCYKTNSMDLQSWHATGMSIIANPRQWKASPENPKNSA